MSEVIYHTFVGEGPENDAFVADIQEQVLKEEVENGI